MTNLRRPIDHLHARITWMSALFEPGADPAAIREDLLARTELPTPMSVLADDFALDARCEDALWLLAASAMTDRAVTPSTVERATGVIRRELQRMAARGLIELERSTIRITDRALELLKGDVCPDPELARIAQLHAGTGDVAPANDAIVVAVGPDTADRERELRTRTPRTFEVDATRLAPEQLRACAREAIRAHATLLLRDADALLGTPALAALDIAIFATAKQLPDLSSIDRVVSVIDVSAPDLAARTALWRSHLVGASDETIAACAARYRLPPELLARVAREVDAPSIDAIQRVLRHRLDRSLAGLARRVSTSQTWTDLVLPEDQLDLLRELVARVQHRTRVLDEWGFAAKVGKGTGIAALFSGPPGTGKTMIAGLVARELGLDLYQVDLSKIVSKYIGETEKQLGALFDAAEHGQAIILFDEADSLFGKRTDVKSSNDRYANLETNYLLQRLEAFDGICLLTTNHEAAIDPAFLRRLSLHIRVPMPDEDHRAKLWRAMLPARADVAPDLDFTDLANEFAMSGGYIKNAVVRAAYLAAADHSRIELAHFDRAARAEYDAIGNVTRRH